MQCIKAVSILSQHSCIATCIAEKLFTQKSVPRQNQLSWGLKSKHPRKDTYSESEKKLVSLSVERIVLSHTKDIAL